MRHLQQAVRNYSCSLLACCLIALGTVRRARERALSEDVITSICFHNPNRRLFSRCIRWLMKHGYVFISAADVADILDRKKALPKRAAWLSFDDGWRDWLENVLPVVRAHHIPVTLFIPSGIVEGNGLFPWLKGATGRNVLPGWRDALTLDELREISKYPEVTIGGHTISHPLTTSCNEKDLRYELRESKRALESWTGTAVTSFAYPCGKFNGRERRYLRDLGYRFAVTTEDVFITPNSNPFLVPRFRVADNIPFLEAVCNMVGVWRPAIDRLKAFFRPSPGPSVPRMMPRAGAGLHS